MESNSKKIQFAVPVLQSPLDPKAAEHIRRRRPTPATLVVYRETTGDVQTSRQPGENTHHAQPCHAQRKRSVYTPPTLTETELTDDSRNQEVKDGPVQTRPLATPVEHSSGAMPRRKDTPYQHLPPFTPGGRLLDTHTPFSEEEEEHDEGPEVEREDEVEAEERVPQ